MKDGQNSQYGGQSPNFVSIFDPQSKGIGIMAGCDVGIHFRERGRKEEGGRGGGGKDRGRRGQGWVKEGGGGGWNYVKSTFKS